MNGREYLRVSLDKSGQERSQDQQHADHVQACLEYGITLGAPYRERGSASASRYAHKARAAFDRLMSDLEHDRFGADVLVLWEGSRGSRKVSEWVALIEACEQRKVKIFIFTYERLFNPANPYDRSDLIDLANKSELASAETSKRVKRDATKAAVDGKPHGRIAYGYAREYWFETVNGKQVRRFRQVIEPDEAAVIRELFQRLHKGHSLRSIAADFERRGAHSRTGKTFSPQYLRSFALNRAYIGERVHDPARGANRRKLSEQATVTTATWPALIDREVFFSVQRRLTAPERKTTRPGRGIHLLSMLARCDVCGGPLTSRGRPDRVHEYTCRDRGCVRISYDDLTKLAEGEMLDYLEQPDNVAWLTERDDRGEAVTAVRGEIAQIRAELDDLAAQVGAGKVSATLAAVAEPAIIARLKDAEQREQELSTPSALRGLIGPGKDVRRRWKAAPMSTRREVARLLLSPQILGELRVTRSATPGHRCPVDDRVMWLRLLPGVQAA